MKLTFSTATLRAAYAAATAAVPTKTAREVLRNVLLISSVDGCKIIGSDGELSVSASLPVQESHGQVLLPPIVGQILREIVAEHVTLDADETSLIIIAEGSRFRIATHDVNDYPPIVEFTGNGPSVLGATLSAAIDATAFACDLGSARYALGGVCMSEAYVVATDSRRLAVYESVTQILPRARVIPLRACNVLRRAFGAVDAVSVNCDENSVTFASDSMRVTTRFVEGRFPKWKDVIPTPEIHHTIRVGDLLRAVRLVSTTTSADDRAVLMQLTETGCRLSSETETGSGAVQVDCGGDGAVEIRVMAEYLSQALQSFPADATIDIGTIASDQAVLLSCGPIRQVIMPITTPG